MVRRVAASDDRIERVAREAFGFAGLRPGQREAIEAALGGRDALVVMSTGSGKSAIYQIAGLLLPRATVVVSPLIALQREPQSAFGGGTGRRRPAPARRRGRGAAELQRAAGEREAALAELAEDVLAFRRPSSSRTRTCSTSWRSRGGQVELAEIGAVLEAVSEAGGPIEPARLPRRRT